MHHQDSPLTPFSWPPPYTMRRSNKAKRISLMIHPTRGLEVVLTQTSRESTGKRMLDQNKAWVKRHWKTIIQIEQNKQQRITNNHLPERLHLRAIGSTLPILYQFDDRPGARATLRLIEAKQPISHRPQDAFYTADSAANPSSKRSNPATHQLSFSWEAPAAADQTPSNQHLLYIGPKDRGRFDAALLKQLKSLCDRHITPLLDEISQTVKLPYSRVSYRQQKTRWGSCTRDGRISLNVNLLFAPLEAVRYVLLHELCHTRYQSHGVRFWGLVERHMPTYKHGIKLLKQTQSAL